MIVLLAVVAAGTMAIGLSARRPAPTQESLPAEILAPESAPGTAR